MHSDADGGFLAPSDVADLAGVSRAAVSNWRRRELDFPKPVGGTKANPLFDRADVERWLKTHRPQTPSSDRPSAGLAMWSVMNGFRRELSMPVMRTLALAVLCGRKLADDTGHAEQLRREASEGRFLEAVRLLAASKSADPRWNQLVTVSPDDLSGRDFDRLAADLYAVVAEMDADDLSRAADYVINRVNSTEGRTAGEYGTVKSPMSRLLAEAARSLDSSTATTAYDPACGIGEALIRFWRGSRNREGLHLYGTEINERYARICRQRCFLYGAEVTVECGDVLIRDPLPGLCADVVMAEPPFGLEMPTGFSLADPRWAVAGLPPKANSDTAWLQHVIAHLALGGRGVVVTALSTTWAQSSAGVRRSLIKRGAVEAVVVLPRKLLTYTPLSTALWIVRAPDRPEAAEQVRFIDASRMDPSGSFDISFFPRAELAEDHTNVLSAWVASENILADEQVRLDPRHWTRAVVEPEEIIDRFRGAVRERDDAIRSIASTDRTFNVIEPSTRTIAIRELEKQGALSIVRAGRTDAELRDSEGPKSIPPWVITRRMIREGLPAHVDLVENAHAPKEPTREDDDNFTAAGDILVITGGFVKAMVDQTGGWLPGPGVSRLIVDPQHFDAHFVAECLNGSWNQPAQLGSPTSVMLRELEIPIIPMADQITLVDNIERMRSASEIGKLIADSSEALIAAQLDALRYGARLEHTPGKNDQP